MPVSSSHRTLQFFTFRHTGSPVLPGGGMSKSWNPAGRRRLVAPAVAISILLLGSAVQAAAQPDDLEARTKRARNGAGLRFGTWQVRGLADPQGGSSSESPAFEGYFEKGLDLHLAWENTFGFWRRTQTFTEQGTFGDTRHKLQSYVVPTFTALKFYPLTRPSDPVEPHVSGGVGFIIGIEREKSTSTDPVIPDSENTAFQIGFGFKVGLGLDWRFNDAFGLTAGGRYQWTEFGEDLGGKRTYEGLGADLGFTYRFQYE
jgi:opacity protein-like surface antigen